MVAQLALVTDDDVARASASARTSPRWTNRARDLVNRPANDLTPGDLAEYAAELADGTPGLTAEVLEPDAMRELGMGALLAVGHGQLQRASPHRAALGASRRRAAATACSGSSARG